MKIKSVKTVNCKEEIFCDISTETSNFLLAESNCVIHNSHISALMMILFLKLVPGLIQDGTKIYRAIMPLYGAMKSGKFIPFYNEEELNKFKTENPNSKIQRYKGLGEMNPNQLKVCLLDKETRRLELIKSPENADEIFKIMTDAETKRGLLGDE